MGLKEAMEKYGFRYNAVNCTYVMDGVGRRIEMTERMVRELSKWGEGKDLDWEEIVRDIKGRVWSREV